MNRKNTFSATTFMMMISKIPPQISPVNALLLLLMCSVMISSIVVEPHPETRTESSSSMIRCIESERQALLVFKQGLVDDYDILASWGSPHHPDCCQWRGVGCSNVTGHVISLDLGVGETQYGNLRGNISDSLLVLKHLNYLSLSGNNFGNYPIPNFIGSLVKLQYLNLSGTGLYGEIPSQFKNLSSLQYLDLSYNSGLFAKNFAWTSTLRLLRTLNLEWVELANATDWVHAINSLPSLTYLDLEYCSLSNPSQGPLVNSSKSLTHILLKNNNLSATSVYPWLFNISSKLVELDLYGNYLGGSIPNEFGNLNSLSFLDISFNQLESTIPKEFGNLSFLSYLSLHGNQLRGPIPKEFGNLSSLSQLDLSVNQLQGPIPEEFGNLNSLSRLDLSENQLQGPIPEGLGSISSLSGIVLNSNQLEGGIPNSFGHLLSLKQLDLSNNNLTGDLGMFLSQSIFKSLGFLRLENNNLYGSLPDITRFPSLIEVDISHNQLNGSFSSSFGNIFSPLDTLLLQNNHLTGSLPEDFGQLSNLWKLDMSSNLLHGIISEVHLSNLSSLGNLDLSYNNLTFNISPNWTPPFKLATLYLDSCMLGPHFPNWLQTQENLIDLSIPDAGVSDSLPSWFWGIFDRGLFVQAYVNLSYNDIHGALPDSVLGDYGPAVLDLSFNSLEGSVPLVFTHAGFLDISDNKLSGSISSWSLAANATVSISSLSLAANATVQYIDLSNNNLSGELPDCWMYMSRLKILNLGNNNFSGRIPNSFGYLNLLEVLNLSNNEFFGEVPSSLKYCRSLRILDLSENLLSGQGTKLVGE
ncbi:hypothetical protein Ancab_040345 [Ancistrocladus abbreviatus]